MQIQFDFIAKLKKDLINLELQPVDDNENVSLWVFDHISRRKQFILAQRNDFRYSDSSLKFCEV